MFSSEQKNGTLHCMATKKNIFIATIKSISPEKSYILGGFTWLTQIQFTYHIHFYFCTQKNRNI